LFEESGQGDEYTDKWRDRNRKELSSSLLVRRVCCSEGPHEMECNGMERNEMKCDAEIGRAHV
jgi:hypothetical protein